MLYCRPYWFTIDIIQVHVDFNSTPKKKYISSLEYQKTVNSQNLVRNLVGITNYSCLRNATLELEAMFDEKHLKAVVVKITLCNNKTRNNTCRSQADIVHFFSDKSHWVIINIQCTKFQTTKTLSEKFGGSSSGC